MLKTPHLIGREQEREAFAAACTALRGGEGTCLLVTGEAGIGKSLLVSDTLGRAGLTVYAGAGRLSGMRPYDPIVQVLRQCLERVPGLVEACGALGPYLGPLLPELGLVAEDAGESALVAAVIRAFTETGSRGSVAVVLDDLHWADDATLLLLPRLAAGLLGVPLLLVGVARDEMPTDTHRVRRLRAELRRVCEPVELRLRHFRREETARLAALIAGEELDDDAVDAVHERAHGIPFYVEELTATLAFLGRRREAGRLPLPDRVLDAVLLRTEALSLPTRNALEMAAVLDGYAGDGRVPGRPEGDTLAEALAAGFLVDAGFGRVIFRHALVRDAVYAAIPWTRRRSLHASVARALCGDDASASERAEHWLGAGDVVQARLSLVEAAASSAAIYAYSDASRMYGRALDLGGGDEISRFDLLERLAVCSELAGDLAGSARAWREAIDGRRGRGETEQVALAEYAIGRVLALRGSSERALAAWTAAADAFAACGRLEDAARSRLAAVQVMQMSGGLRPALTAVEAVLAELPPDAPRELASRARSLHGVVLGKLGATERALTSAHAALSEALAAGHPASAAAAYEAFAVVYENAGELRKAGEAYEVAIEYCTREGVADSAAVCTACLCHILRQRGEWTRSLTLSRALLADPATDEASRGAAAAVASQIHASRGERRPASLLVMESAPIVRRLRMFGPEIECAWTLARLALLEGSNDAAVEHCRDILRRFDESEDGHYSLNALAWSTPVFAAWGSKEDLNRSVSALVTIAARNGNAEALAMLSRALGELASYEEDAPTAVEHFRRALEIHQSIELPHDRAEMLVSAAAAASASGLDDQAREWLTDARLSARRLAARPLLAAAQQQLAQRSAGADTTAGSGLTPRQLQVIRRVADGRTNREIASEMYLSVRTVDMHVRHSLSTLGCRSRVEAVRKATEMGLLQEAADRVRE